MCAQTAAKRGLTGLYFLVIYWLLSGIAKSVNGDANIFTLPALPGTPYTLKDVIVLPKNKNFVEITLLSTETNSVLTTLNVTDDDEFRLGKGVSSSDNISIESVLKIVTMDEVTTLIQLSTELLHILPFSDYANRYVFQKLDEPDKEYNSCLYIHCETQGTSVTTCPLIHDKNDGAVNELMISLQEIPSTPSCETINVSSSQILQLNNTLIVRGVEITSNHPVRILERRTSFMSPSVRNGRDFNTSTTPVSPISWNIISPYKEWSNQFVLIPSEDKREVNLRIMSLEDSTVLITGNGEETRHNLTAMITRNTTISVAGKASLQINGDNKLSMNCIESNVINCNDDIIAVKLGEFSTTSSNAVNNSNEYRWIFVPNGVTVNILCPAFVEVSLYSLNGTTEHVDVITLNASRQILYINYFRQVRGGLYRLVVNDSLRLCSWAYSKKQRPYTNLVSENNKSTIKPISISGTRSSMPSNTDNIRSVSEYMKTPQAKVTDVAMLTPYEESTDSWLDEGESKNISASMSFYRQLTSTSNYNTTHNGIVSEKISINETQTSIQISKVKLTKDSTGNTEMQFHKDVNKEFKAVVDILQTRNGTLEKLLPQENKSEKSNHETYIYRFNINDTVEREGDGKSALALIISLLSALVAVGVIILVFLLKEFLSRRQQIRNTKIRPFISDY